MIKISEEIEKNKDAKGVTVLRKWNLLTEKEQF
jgi:hypothetical protein